MTWRFWSALLLVLSACASVPAPSSRPRPQVLAPALRSGPSIQRVSAPVETGHRASGIGRAELEQARALLARARNDLEPRHWDALERKLTAAQQAFEHFSRVAKTSGQVAEVGRGTGARVQAGHARMFAAALPRVATALMVLVLLYPSNTASAERDRRPEWVEAQWAYEARLRDVSEASQQLLVELEAQPRRVANAANVTPSPRKQAASASEREEDPRCTPIPLPRHLGGNGLHNECADKMPGNSFPGGDVFVNGKNFDALQMATRTLWDVKTDDFEKQSPRSQRFFVRMKLTELRREDRLARECGYDFVVGVKSAAHKAVLAEEDPTLRVVIMDWC